MNKITFNEDTLNRFRLIRTPYIGSLSYRYLIQKYKTPCMAIEAISITHNVMSVEVAINEMQSIINDGWNLLFSSDVLYPYNMNKANGSPFLIYKGNINLLKNRCVGIVGTRIPSLHGINFCKKITQDLIDKDYVIVSGIAEGIDTCAHVVNMSRTIGVLAGGAALISKDSLAQKIIDAGGLVITDQPHNMPISKFQFPNRNKIIAALCNGLIVIEAPLNSGSLLTAQNANDLMKYVYVMPGRPNDIKTEGGNLFLSRYGKNNNVNIFLSADDFRFNTYFNEDKIISFGDNSSSIKPEVILSLLNNTPMNITSISEHLKIEIGLLLTTLVQLEMQGKIFINNYTVFV